VTTPTGAASGAGGRPSRDNTSSDSSGGNNDVDMVS
jgi:hypothetical protein